MMPARRDGLLQAYHIGRELDLSLAKRSDNCRKLLMLQI